MIFGKNRNPDEEEPIPVPQPEEAPAEKVTGSVPGVPENFDFNRYFLAERRIMLENVSYETASKPLSAGQYKMGVKDTIVAQVRGQTGVKATYNRALTFEPEGPFTLSVTFSVMLVFNPGTRAEVDWRTIDMAAAFRRYCPNLVQTMMAKSALLVAEITNANGMPVIPLR